MKNKSNNVEARPMFEALEDRLCMSGDPHVGGMLVALGDGSVRSGDGSVRLISSSISSVTITDGTSNLKITDGTSNTLIGLL
jgi:hypothetical protein